MRKPIHPGRILMREMAARKMTANQLAKEMFVPANRITALIDGQRGVSADIALRLGQYFGNDPKFWMNLQINYELALAENGEGEKILRKIAMAMHV